MTRKTVEWIAIAFFAGLVALVFQQILTSMTEQGIASGGPYDNAASFPKTVAIAIAGLIFVQIAAVLITSAPSVEETPNLRRPVAMLAVFAIYLGLLTPLGYHLTTAPMIFAIMWICGARQLGPLILTALAMAFVAAFVFERFLNVVLPGGVFALHMPW